MLCAFSLCLATCLTAHAEPYASSYARMPYSPVLIVNATILTGTGERIENGSLLMAALAYLVISIEILAYWVSVFPEVNLVVLGIIIALGRYTGFRLTELVRFSSLSDSKEG